MVSCELLIVATEPVAAYRIRGAGSGIAGQRDEGFFAYTQKSGSFRIQGHLRWAGPNARDWAKLGLMVRDSAGAPASANAFGGIRGRLCGDLLYAQSRPAENEETIRWRGYMQDNEGRTTIAEKHGGVWLRLSRYAGCIFNGRADLCEFEYSLDGVEWRLFSRQVVELTDPVAVGFAIDSESAGPKLAEAMVSGVTVVEATPPPSIPAWLAEAPPGTGKAELRRRDR